MPLFFYLWSSDSQWSVGKRIGCPQRKRLGLLPWGCREPCPGSTRSLLRWVMLGVWLPKNHHWVCVHAFIELFTHCSHSSHQREPSHHGCWPAPAPKGAGGFLTPPRAQGAHSELDVSWWGMEDHQPSSFLLYWTKSCWTAARSHFRLCHGSVEGAAVARFNWATCSA